MTNLSDILPPSNVVTDTSTDTLTNKTLTSPKVNEDVAVTSTATELNILDGVTSTTAELNILDGVTSTAAELNALDGITAVVGELNALDIGSTAVGTAVASKAVILDSNKDYTGVRNLTISGELDAATLDISGDVDIDGTLETDALSLNGTAVTSTAAELNILDGVTATAAEINYLDGVTSAIQTQIDGGSSVVRSARTSNTILDGDDNSVLIDITSGTFSQTLTASATLGSGWFCYYKNSGTGIVTIDPNGSETVNGAATLKLYIGAAILLQCDGSNFNIIKLTQQGLVAQTFTSSGSITLPADMSSLFVEILGSGGGGGSGGRSNNTVACGGAGGGGGRFIVSQCANLSPYSGASTTVTVGAGGAGGAARAPAGAKAGLVGATGGTTSFGSLSLTGAIGGAGGIITGSSVSGGATGTIIESPDFVTGVSAAGSAGADANNTSTASSASPATTTGGGSGGGAGGGALTTAGSASGAVSFNGETAASAAGSAGSTGTSGAGTAGTAAQEDNLLDVSNLIASLTAGCAGSGGGGSGGGNQPDGNGTSGAGGAGGLGAGGGGSGGVSSYDTGGADSSGAGGAGGAARIIVYWS